MSVLEQQKHRLRGEMRSQRARLSEAEQQLASEQLTSAMVRLPNWAECHSISFYLANDGEIDPLSVITSARLLEKEVLLPVLDGASLSFALWSEGEALEINRFGIPEPCANATRFAPDDIDIICLPLVAWNKEGGRLGMGGGFYDRALANVQDATVVGLGYSFQQAENIPMQEWDVRLQFVATETGLIRCSR